MLKPSFVLSILLAAALNGFSQEKEITLQFVSFPKSIKAEPVELLVGPGETIEVELPTNSLSPEYKVSPQQGWALGESGENEEGEFVFKTYGSAPSLSSSNQLILVIRKGLNDEDGFQLIPMDNRQSGFGGGEYFFMNAAQTDIAAELGDTKFALKPRSHKLVKPKPSKVDGKRKYLYVYLHYRKGEEAVPFYSSTWRLSDKARCMVFFYHDTHTKQLRTHTIRDYIE